MLLMEPISVSYTEVEVLLFRVFLRITLVALKTNLANAGSMAVLSASECYFCNRQSPPHAPPKKSLMNLVRLYEMSFPKVRGEASTFSRSVPSNEDSSDSSEDQTFIRAPFLRFPHSASSVLEAHHFYQVHFSKRANGYHRHSLGTRLLG